MKRLFAIAPVVVALLAPGPPAAAQEVHVDYDRSIDVKSYKTFAWASGGEPTLQAASPLMHSRIKNAIELELTKSGLVEDTEGPDLLVTYYTDSQQEVSFSTTSMGYGYGPGWGWDPYWGGSMSTATTTAHTYDRGTLVIDIWDTERKQAVFRGTASAIVPDKPQKAEQLIDRAVTKIAAKFRKMYAKEKS
jgi:hypothetical protein